MAPSYDCTVSSLLCAEETAILGELDSGEEVEAYGSEATYGDDDYYESSSSSSLWSRLDHRSRDLKTRSFAGGVVPPPPLLQSDEVLGSMVERESLRLPDSGYFDRLKSGDLDLFSRNIAVDWIIKANAHFGFGPLCSFLSINYFDRFLSAYELPKGKAWTMQLLAVACLSLAAKMEEINVPFSLDLQVVGDSKFLFEARTVQRMELLVLSTLKWRMNSVTPFNFIDNFLHKIINYHDHDDQDQSQPIIIPLSPSILLRSSQLILGILKGIDFLQFKPSEIAAAVTLCVASETKSVDTEKAIPLFLTQQHLEKERVVKCVQLVNGTATLVNGSVGAVQLVPQSPIGVLEATACLSYKSDDISIGSSFHNSVTNSSSSASSISITHNKRRRLNPATNDVV